MATRCSGRCARCCAPRRRGRRAVLVLGPRARSAREDPFLTAPALPRRPAAGGAVPPHRAPSAAGLSVSPASLRGCAGSHAISRAAYRRIVGDAGARGRARPAAFAAPGRPSWSGDRDEPAPDRRQRACSPPSRLPALFLTLERNRAVVDDAAAARAPASASSSRARSWSGSTTRGRGSSSRSWAASARPTASTRPAVALPELRQLLDELIPLAAKRAGGLDLGVLLPLRRRLAAVDERDGAGHRARGADPRLSGVRLSAAYSARRPPRATGLSAPRAPAGVSVRTHAASATCCTRSPRRAIEVINGFLQTLIGLYDYAQASGDREARRLFAAGDAEARAEVPHYDTGAWSLYQPGVPTRSTTTRSSPASSSSSARACTRACTAGPPPLPQLRAATRRRGSDVPPRRLAPSMRPARSSTRARVASARPRSPPAPREAAPRPGCGRS